jgi:hypothetical protein
LLPKADLLIDGSLLRLTKGVPVSRSRRWVIAGVSPTRARTLGGYYCVPFRDKNLGNKSVTPVQFDP